jgi:hypothetical protein
MGTTLQQLQNEIEQLNSKEKILKVEMGISNFNELSTLFKKEIQKRNLHSSLVNDFLNHLNRTFQLEHKHQKY